MTIEYSKSKKKLVNNFLDLIVFRLDTDTAYIFGYNGELQLTVTGGFAENIINKTLNGYLEKEA